MSFQLTEIAVNAILTHLRDNISAELAAVNTARGDNKYNLIRPQEYFIFPTSKNYRKPAIFVIAEGLGPFSEQGANHINAVHDINVSVVLEDRSESLLTIGAWRYQAAITKLLHLVQLAGPTNQSKLICKVSGTTYSPLYTEDAKVSSESVFCKEVLVSLNVDHYEPL